LPRDHYVRVDSNDYSVHPAAIGQRIEIVTDLARVQVFNTGRPVAEHARVWARHQSITDPAHLAAAKAMRRDRIAVVRPESQAEVEIRRLGDYDDALGLDATGPDRLELEGGAA
jgi:hypothetical protein